MIDTKPRNIVHNLTELGKAILAATAGFFVALVLITAFLSASGQLNLSYSPIEYTSDVITISEPVCPGDVVAFESVYRGLYANARVALFSEVRNMQTNDKFKMPTDGLPIDNYIVISEDMGQIKTVPVTFTLPSDIPAGNYVWVGFAQATNKIPATLRALFTVKDCTR